jgi:hypothetical protein
MTIDSRAKGKRGELQVVATFNRGGFNCWRTPNSGAFHHSPGDIRGIPGLHVECKDQKVLRIKEWIAQAEKDCEPGNIPVLVYKTAPGRWQVSMDLEDFVPVWRHRVGA